MQIPPEISFHNIEKPDWAEESIRAHIAKLEKIFNRMITCRVRVDQTANNSNQTVPPVVHIEISIPRFKDIVVAHEPDHLQRKFQSPDLHNAINEAFRIASDRLSQFKDQVTDHTAVVRHEGAQEYLGQVAEVQPDKDFGFLMTKEGGLLYFHRSSVLSGDFDSFQRGLEVHYVEEVGDTGPIATKVRAKVAA